MFPIPDTLAAFYLTCFSIGFLFVLVSLLLGFGHDTLQLPGIHHGHMDVGHLGDLGHTVDAGTGSLGGLGHNAGSGTGGPGDAGSGHATPTAGQVVAGSHGVSPFNLMTIMAFLTWFGGGGYILHVYGQVWGGLSLVGASLVGLVGGAIVFWVLARVFIPNQRFLDPADYEMEGTVARVSLPIREGLVGEIVYTRAGTTRSEGARSVNDGAIEKDTEVVIVRYDRGIAYVEPWSSFVKQG